MIIKLILLVFFLFLLTRILLYSAFEKPKRSKISLALMYCFFGLTTTLLLKTRDVFGTSSSAWDFSNIFFICSKNSSGVILIKNEKVKNGKAWKKNGREKSYLFYICLYAMTRVNHCLEASVNLIIWLANFCHSGPE